MKRVTLKCHGVIENTRPISDGERFSAEFRGQKARS
jgi:hypothetical protein